MKSPNTFILGMMALFILLELIPGPVTSQAPSAEEGRLTLPVVDALPPPGTILPYAGPEDRIPRGWTLCDGKVLDDSGGLKKDQVDPFLWGKKVPDMSGRFLRGRIQGEFVGQADGRSKIPAHKTSEDGIHAHSFTDPVRGIDGYTGPAARGGPVANFADRSYDIVNPFGAYADGHSYLTNQGDHADQYARGSGQHRHLFEKLNDGNDCATARSAGDVATNPQEGTHSHNIPDVDFVPSYVATNFIIRIK